MLENKSENNVATMLEGGGGGVKTQWTGHKKKDFFCGFPYVCLVIMQKNMCRCNRKQHIMKFADFVINIYNPNYDM